MHWSDDAGAGTVDEGAAVTSAEGTLLFTGGNEAEGVTVFDVAIPAGTLSPEQLSILVRPIKAKILVLNIFFLLCCLFNKL